MPMEKFPSRSHERKAEKVLSSEEVLAAIAEHDEGFTLGRELSDEQGVYLREVVIQGEAEGETTEYIYMRKGRHGSNIESSETVIRKMTFQDGIPVSQERVATLDEETGEWKKPGGS